jgi:dUTP pyrophosphatase
MKVKPLQVKIKKLHKDAVIPFYSKQGDAGMDLTAVWDKNASDTNKPYSEYGTGLSVEIPTGYVGLIFPRSSISKTFFSLANAVAVIDSGFRGEITLRFSVTGTGALLTHHLHTGDLLPEEWDSTYPDGHAYKVGDKIGQLIILPYPQIQFIEADELTPSERGANGYGSTGK